MFMPSARQSQVAAKLRVKISDKVVTPTKNFHSFSVEIIKLN
jgi:hypothetical protein